MTAREFDLGDILSITHDCLLSPRLVQGCYDILNFMTGDNLFTHQLPRAARECAPVLFLQHPWLREIGVEGIGKDNWRERMDVLYAKHGRMHLVEPVGPGVHECIDPMSELAEKVHPDRIIPIITR
jgi:hypothetical protein